MLGREHGFNSISHLAFDRIERIAPLSGVSYIENTKYDFNDDYFSDIVGVTKYLEYSPIKIGLWVSEALYPYIQTKPLHGSQKLKRVCADGCELEIEVRPNYELEQLILSYGEGLRVLYPVSLRDRIKERLVTSLENYKSAHDKS